MCFDGGGDLYFELHFSRELDTSQYSAREKWIS